MIRVKHLRFDFRTPDLEFLDNSINEEIKALEKAGYHVIDNDMVNAMGGFVLVKLTYTDEKNRKNSKSYKG